MDFVRFLKHLILIKNRKKQEVLLSAHVASMVNATEEGWEQFRLSLGLAPSQIADVVDIADDYETDLSAIDALRDTLE